MSVCLVLGRGKWWEGQACMCCPGEEGLGRWWLRGEPPNCGENVCDYRPGKDFSFQFTNYLKLLHSYLPPPSSGQIKVSGDSCCLPGVKPSTALHYVSSALCCAGVVQGEKEPRHR